MVDCAPVRSIVLATCMNSLVFDAAGNLQGSTAEGDK
jgi:hypothetical protein